MQPIELWQLISLLCVIAYIAICFAFVARRHGRNPWLWGILSIVSPLNLIILGYWAMTGRLPGRRGA